MEKALTPVKEAIDKSLQDYALNYSQLKSFLEESYGKSKILGIADKVSDNYQDIVDLLDLTYSLTEEKSLKARCAKLKKKLCENTNTSDTDSVHSTNSEASENL